ncbi:MAG TPA: hypothetical protein VG815_04310, partial [Chloroflexota bacterium]|nr:hypothetical protein [Chloroflexota bacterium]
MPQPLVATLSWGALGAGAIAYDLSGWQPVQTGGTWTNLAVAPTLMVAVGLAFRFPIHVRHNLKLYMATVPLFILAAAVTPVVAAAFAGAGWFAGEVMARKHTGAYITDMLTGTARYAAVVLMTSIVAHAAILPNFSVRLLTAICVFWVAEALTLPVAVCPINGEPPIQVIVAFTREAGPAEVSQYALGLIGALLVGPHAWSVALLTIPAILTYGAFKNAKEMRETTLQMLESMADTVDLRDPYTGGHSRRVADYTL